MDKKGKSTRILVIRLSAMGDVAMTIPVIKTVLDKYPKVELTVLTKGHFSPIFSQLDRVTVFEADVENKHRGLVGLWRLYKELRTFQFTAVADLHNVLRSGVLKKYFALDGIPVIQLNKGRSDKKALTRASNKKFRQFKTTPQRYADVFGELGYPIKLEETILLERQQLSENVVELVGQDSKKWIGIAPFAAHQGKMYPLHLMREVVALLCKTDKYKILLFGGGALEIQQLNTVASSFKNTLNMAGKLNFSQELQLISNLDVMLSMDSGNAHMAAKLWNSCGHIMGSNPPFCRLLPF